MGKSIPSRYQSLLTAPTPSTTEIAEEDGRSRILGYEPISLPSSPLYVGAGIDEDIAFSNINRATIYCIALI